LAAPFGLPSRILTDRLALLFDLHTEPLDLAGRIVGGLRNDPAWKQKG
jgi:hypothetical protein